MDQDTRIAGPEPPAVKNATDARQGANRAPIHYVLFGGLALAAVAFILMFTVRLFVIRSRRASRRRSAAPG